MSLGNNAINLYSYFGPSNHTQEKGEHKFRPYILGSHLIIHIDHAAIKYLVEKKEARPRLIRWVLVLQKLDLEIKYKKGSENVIADHLSRLKMNARKEKGNEIAESFPNE